MYVWNELKWAIRSKFYLGKRTIFVQPVQCILKYGVSYNTSWGCYLYKQFHPSTLGTIQKEKGMGWMKCFNMDMVWEGVRTQLCAHTLCNDD